MKNLTIRKAVKSDAKFILSMINELATFEKAPEQVLVTLEKLEADGFSEKPLFESIILESNNSEIGMALFYYRYSTWKGKSLYLEDLYIKTQNRGSGFGTYVMKWLANYAHINDCKRFEWQVLDWNTPAIKLYQKLGADLDEEWINCRLEGESLLNYRS
jgi:GNAT superfamily N-acetyltransferase